MTYEKHLSEYSDQEKLAYLTAIASMAAIDNDVDPNEIENFKNLCKLAKINEETQNKLLLLLEKKDFSDIPLREYIENLANSELRINLMIDLLFMAYADGKVVPEEEEEIKKLATFLKINEKELNSLRMSVELTTKSKDSDNINVTFKTSGNLITKIKSFFKTMLSF